MRPRVGRRRGEGFWVAPELLEPDVLEAVPVVRAEEGVLLSPVIPAGCVYRAGQIWPLRVERMVSIPSLTHGRQPAASTS